VAARYSASWVHVFTGRNTRGALLHAEEGLAQAGDDLELGADQLGFSPKLMTDATRSQILCQLGRLDEARAGLDRLLPYDMDSHPVAVAATGIYGGALAERLDDPAAAMLEARRMVAQLEKQPELIETVVIGAHFYISVAHRMNGRWDDAITAIDEALSRSEAGQSMLMMGPEMRMNKARVLVEMGQRDQALALLDEAVESARKQELGRGLAAPLLCRAELRALGDDASPDEILSDIDEAAGIVDSEELIAFQPDVHEARAALAALRGDPSTRKRELERARDLAQDMGAPLRAERNAALLD
jgi:tetratricopeptide (TPR) repeat protein